MASFRDSSFSGGGNDRLSRDPMVRELSNVSVDAAGKNGSGPVTARSGQRCSTPPNCLIDCCQVVLSMTASRFNASMSVPRRCSMLTSLPTTLRGRGVTAWTKMSRAAPCCLGELRHAL